MNPESWLALVVALIILGLSPGPGWAAVVTTSVTRGFKSALLMATGIATGDVVFVLLAVFGLAAVASVLGGLFIVVKFAGAAYLIYLGWSLWRNAERLTPDPQSAQTPSVSAFFTGLAITMGNPKVIAFYLGFLPAFMDLGRITYTQITLLVATVFCVILTVLAGYAAIATQSRVLLQRRRVRSAVGKLAGATLIATGAAIALRK